MLKRPDKSECHPYYMKYIDKVEGHDFLSSLGEAQVHTSRLLSQLSEEEWTSRYAPDKWSVKEVLMHVIDTERIFCYRALRMARHDKTPIEGFEQDDYVPFCGADYRTPESIIKEYIVVRESTLSLFRNFNDEMYSFKGVACELPFTPLAIGYFIVGHEIHHMDIIRDRYLRM